MEQNKTQVIQTRFGEQKIFFDNILYFPKGIIGFENLQSFVLLEIKADSPFWLLQSTESASLGLLVANPHSFMKEYAVSIDANDRKILQLEGDEDFAVLVTVSIPHGAPEEATLNLSGPIVINSKLQRGLQIPQVSPLHGKNVFLKSLALEASQSL